MNNVSIYIGFPFIQHFVGHQGSIILCICMDMTSK